MNFEPSKINCMDKLEKFIQTRLSKYHVERNFDFGSYDRSNTSCLSPYISHGIISEIEIIKSSVKDHSIKKIEKFIQEVLWRVYWKGWLELRPNVWLDFIKDLKFEKNKFLNDKNYLNAINGNTEIKCFNDWINELRTTNYLHNHTRMWFASIWIFTLKLPWQLGAEFFLENLLDGDPASNTLGWRWVAGIQTIGKNYLAKEENIKKFTKNKYKNIILNEIAPPIEIKIQYPLINNEFLNPDIIKEKLLLIFDNNLSFETSDFSNKNFKKIFIINNNSRKIKLSNNVNIFKNRLIEDQQKRLEKLSINSEIIQIDELKNLSNEAYALYPCIGENLDFLNKNKINNIKFLYREIDNFSWKHCKKGFFNFKNYIPEIINNFNC